MKTSELTGQALDWAVAKCEGDAEITYDPDYEQVGFYDYDDVFTPYAPSTDWAQGGPIIEREEISVEREFSTRDNWAAWTPAPIRDESEAFGYGETPLIAAMRCLVASKLGDEVEIPEEL